jgi:O-antigen/teichoic acid export membrane protein
MGSYNVAAEISAMPSGELLAPLYRALFPAFVQAREDPAELRRIYLLAQGLQAMIVIPASVGLALVASEIVSLLLGPKWMLVVPLLQVLALVEAGNALLTGSGYILLTMGRVRSTAAIAWSQVLSLAVLALVVFPGAGALEIAWLRVASVACGVLVAIAILRGVVPGLRTRDVMANAWRPVLGTGVMVGVILALGEAVELAVLSALLTKVLLGAVVYVLSISALWVLSGRPIGSETYAMEKAWLLWARITRQTDPQPR